MSTQATVNLLVRRIRQRANQVNSATFDDAAELKPWLRGSLSQLYEVMVSRWQDFYVVPRPLSLTAGVNVYALPRDFRSLQAVYVLASGGLSRARLTPFQPERTFLSPQAAPQGAPMQYRVVRDTLYLSPTPISDAVNAIEVWYTPMYRGPLLDYTPIDDVLPNGWEEWVVLDVLKKMSIKTRLQKGDDIDKDRQRVENRLLSAASIRTDDAPVMRDISMQRSPTYVGTAPAGPAYWTVA